jgi:hypothetical protein
VVAVKTKWNGDEWRWALDDSDVPSRSTIAVIESASLSYEEYAKQRERTKDARKVPFGFHAPDDEGSARDG